VESLSSVHIDVLTGGDAGSLCDFAASTSVSARGQIDPIGEIGRRCFAEHDAMLAGQLGFVYNIFNHMTIPITFTAFFNYMTIPLYGKMMALSKRATSSQPFPHQLRQWRH
jgi:hypothetical protein